MLWWQTLEELFYRYSKSFIMWLHYCNSKRNALPTHGTLLTMNAHTLNKHWESYTILPPSWLSQGSIVVPRTMVAAMVYPSRAGVCHRPAGYSLVTSLINSAIEVWLASEPLAACMWGSWETNCLISPTVLALCLSWKGRNSRTIKQGRDLRLRALFFGLFRGCLICMNVDDRMAQE